MKIEEKTTLVIVGIVLVVAIYVGSLLYFIWSINEVSLDRSGLFGDSFGALTSLFSGLAFAGIIATLLLQREDLKLARAEAKNNEFLQKENIRINALTVLLDEYRTQIQNNEHDLNGAAEAGIAPTKKLMDEQDYLYKQKAKMVRDLEATLFSDNSSN